MTQTEQKPPENDGHVVPKFILGCGILYAFIQMFKYYAF